MSYAAIGTVCNNILSPYFLIMNVETYFHFETSAFEDYLDDRPTNIWFQQDGAPPHN